MTTPNNYIPVAALESGLSNQSIAAYAAKVGNRYGIYDANGRADIESLLRQLGGSIEYHDGPESLKISTPRQFTVYIPSFTSARRDRFTVAHELGHFFLHYIYLRKNGPDTFTRAGTNRAETEANVFASNLLMPEQSYRAAFEAHGPNFWEIASIFDVSPLAAEVRAKVLGLYNDES